MELSLWTERHAILAIRFSCIRDMAEERADADDDIRGRCRSIVTARCGTIAVSSGPEEEAYVEFAVSIVRFMPKPRVT